MLLTLVTSEALSGERASGEVIIFPLHTCVFDSMYYNQYILCIFFASSITPYNTLLQIKLKIFIIF